VRIVREGHYSAASPSILKITSKLPIKNKNILVNVKLWSAAPPRLQGHTWQSKSAMAPARGPETQQW
jgi:hypothetical protein